MALPLELIYRITALALESDGIWECSMLAPLKYNTSTRRADELDLLARLCRVSRTFNAAFSPQLWRHVGFSDQALLHINSENPRLEYVRSFTFTLGTKDDPVYMESVEEPSTIVVFLPKMPELRHAEIIIHMKRSRLEQKLADALREKLETLHLQQAEVSVTFQVNHSEERWPRTPVLSKTIPEGACVTFMRSEFWSSEDDEGATCMLVNGVMRAYAPDDLLACETPVKADVQGFITAYGFRLLARLITHLNVRSHERYPWCSWQPMPHLTYLAMTVQQSADPFHLFQILSQAAPPLVLLEVKIRGFFLGFMLGFYRKLKDPSPLRNDLRLPPSLKTVRIHVEGFDWRKDTSDDGVCLDMCCKFQRAIDGRCPSAEESEGCILGVRPETFRPHAEWLRLLDTEWERQDTLNSNVEWYAKESESLRGEVLMPLKEDAKAMLAGFWRLHGITYNLFGAGDQEPFIYELPVIGPSDFIQAENANSTDDETYDDSEAESSVGGSSDDWDTEPDQ